MASHRVFIWHHSSDLISSVLMVRFAGKLTRKNGTVRQIQQNVDFSHSKEFHEVLDLHRARVHTWSAR